MTPIGLGEDGPTHQAVEQIPTLRMIPNMNFWRACDSVESAVALKSAIEFKAGPSCLIFSRQSLPHLERGGIDLQNIYKGGYILKKPNGTPEVIVLATGSEVQLAIEAVEQSSKKVRVVSMPFTSVFDMQSSEYKEFVMPKNIESFVAVEAAVTDGWYKYVGLNAVVVGLDRFGESAPVSALFEITTHAVIKAIDEVCEQKHP